MAYKCRYCSYVYISHSEWKLDRVRPLGFHGRGGWWMAFLRNGHRQPGESLRYDHRGRTGGWLRRSGLWRVGSRNGVQNWPERLRLDRVRSLDRHRRIRWVLPLRSHGDGHARSPVWRCLIRCWLELHQPCLRSQAAAQSAVVPSSSSRHNNRQKSDAGIEGPASFPSQRKKSIAELLCELHEDFVTRS
jgi:hypothetical protein